MKKTHLFEIGQVVYYCPANKFVCIKGIVVALGYAKGDNSQFVEKFGYSLEVGEEPNLTCSEDDLFGDLDQALEALKAKDSEPFLLKIESPEEDAQVVRADEENLRMVDPRNG